MPFIADTHVHLYPMYDMSLAFASAIGNLKLLLEEQVGEKSTGEFAKVCCLTERHDCFFYSQFLDSPESLLPPGYSLTLAEDGIGLLLHHSAGEMLVIFPGRQIITEEGLELLALGSDARVPERLPFAEAKRQVVELGALPVLNWAPGKWFFSRGRQVQRILEEEAHDSLAICDTTLRPKLWRRPGLMCLAQTRGFPVIAGSDPLPFCGEEQLIGSYGIISKADFLLARPFASFKQAVIGEAKNFSAVGERSGSLHFLARYLRNEMERRF